MPLLLIQVAKITPDVSRAFAMAVASVGVYLGQFLSPVVLKFASSVGGKGDVFKAQFNFLTMGLAIATLVAFLIAFKNRKNIDTSGAAIPMHH